MKFTAGFFSIKAEPNGEVQPTSPLLDAQLSLLNYFDIMSPNEFNTRCYTLFCTVLEMQDLFAFEIFHLKF